MAEARCIFCGTRKQTETHLFRKGWLKQFFEGETEFATWIKSERAGGEDKLDRTWTSREYDHAPGAACIDCNSGWMNEIDQAAERIIEPMLLGKPTTVDDLFEQARVARWVCLVAILMDQLQREPMYPKEAIAWFYEWN